MSHAHSHHDHAHDHGHSHAPQVSTRNERVVLAALVLTSTYMLVEVAGGLLSGSLALLADAGHMLSDTAALALAWFAFHLGGRPADPRRSFGYSRFQILAAFVNGLALFLVAGWIFLEALQRLQTPGPVLAGPMLVVAVIGLLVNIIGFVILHRGDRHNVNMRGALLHVVGDLLGSVAAIVAAIVIMATGWTAIDPILAVLVALLILRSAWDLVRRSGHILLEGTPDGIDPVAVIHDLTENIPGVINVHHLHIWALTGEKRLASLHLQVADPARSAETLTAVQQRLLQRFNIDHCTVQIETTPCHPDQQGCAH